MLAKDFLEIERIINTLNIENKDKLVSSITFMLINSAGNNNTIEAFGLMQRIMSLLVIGNQKKFLSEVNAVLVKCILEQGSNEFFPALQRISENMLLPEARQKLIDDANFVLENTLKNANLDMMSILMAQHTNPQNNPQPTMNHSTSEPIDKMKEVTQPISQPMPPNMTQTGTFQPPPMPPTGQSQNRPPMPPNMTQTGTFQPPPMPIPNPMTQTGNQQMPPVPNNQSLLVNQIKITPQGGQNLLRATNPNVDARKIIPSIMQNENINITSENKLNKSMTLTGSYKTQRNWRKCSTRYNTNS